LFLTLVTVSSAAAQEASSDVPTSPNDPQVLGWDDETAAEIERLQGLWKAWDDQPVPLRVTGWMLVVSCREQATAVRRKFMVDELLSGLESLVEQETLTLSEMKAITNQAFPERTGSAAQAPVGNWTRFELITDEGQRLRFRTLGEAGDETTRVRTSDREEMYRAHQKQGSVFDVPTQLHRLQREDFLYHPPPIRAVGLTRDSGTDTTGIISNGKFHLEYERSTGFILRHVLRLSETRYLSERIQRRPRSTTRGLPIAGLSLTMKYHQAAEPSEPAVRLAILSMVTACEINHPVTEDDFRVAVPAGTTVVHFPAANQAGDPDPDAHKPRAEVATNPVDDTRAYTQRADFGEAASDSRLRREPIDQQRPARRTWLILGFVNGAVLLTALVLILRRRVR
jgi:hypothetical protein